MFTLNCRVYAFRSEISGFSKPTMAYALFSGTDRTLHSCSPSLAGKLHSCGLGLAETLHGCDQSLAGTLHGYGPGLAGTLHGRGPGLAGTLHGYGPGLPGTLHGYDPGIAGTLHGRGPAVKTTTGPLQSLVDELVTSAQCRAPVRACVADQRPVPFDQV